ncbi:MAG: hypothetical protein ACRDG9_15930, partial [Actinomycetota bacterium]
PVLTEAPIELAKPVTVAPGHRIAIRLAVSFVGTSGHTLYFDCDEYPSGLRLTTGTLEEQPPCRVDTRAAEEQKQEEESPAP